MARFGATILDATGLTLSAEEKAFFREANPFGFILFGRNIDSPNQVRRLCAELRECVGRQATITIDQEGGRVQRLRPPIARDWLPPLDFARAAESEAEAAMYLRYRVIAAELRDLGIDSNCAPMVDLAGAETHDFLMNRCYGSDPDVVASLGRAVAQGLLDGGVLPVLKHMPGHGRTTLDSHFDLPTVTASAEDLLATDFAPFKALNDLPMGMTAHLVFSAIDNAPATLSATVMQMIRDDLGFDGLIMTDDISMKALTGTPAEIARASLAAGCDVVLHCNASLADRRAVADAAGEMSDTAQARAERALTARQAPQELDIRDADAQLQRLLNGA